MNGADRRVLHLDGARTRDAEEGQGAILFLNSKKAMYLRIFLILLLGTTSFSCQSPAESETPAERQPNVVIIFMDDMDYANCYHNPLTF
ncbi:MAG: hypothetical protein ACJAZ9_000398 [Neolewinella sp.]|jgi:hypothetical protein